MPLSNLVPAIRRWRTGPYNELTAVQSEPNVFGFIIFIRPMPRFGGVPWDLAVAAVSGISTYEKEQAG
jgi:hypothetical protein